MKAKGTRVPAIRAWELSVFHADLPLVITLIALGLVGFATALVWVYAGW